jgi:hypothetical protein
MHPPSGLQPRERRYHVCHQARIDAETHIKLEEVARTFSARVMSGRLANHADRPRVRHHRTLPEPSPSRPQVGSNGEDRGTKSL